MRGLRLFGGSGEPVPTHDALVLGASVALTLDAKTPPLDQPRACSPEVDAVSIARFSSGRCMHSRNRPKGQPMKGFRIAPTKRKQDASCERGCLTTRRANAHVTPDDCTALRASP
jgi:hypothetical protein